MSDSLRQERLDIFVGRRAAIGSAHQIRKNLSGAGVFVRGVRGLLRCGAIRCTGWVANENLAAAGRVPWSFHVEWTADVDAL